LSSTGFKALRLAQISKMTDGHHHIEGTDLEVVFNRHGDNLVLRVNKAPAQVFRVLLVDACKDMPEDHLMRLNSVAPDVGVQDRRHG
jgi:hypothetical protein